MSFLQPKIIPRGYIATNSNKTIPGKRLNSVSEISLKPALPNLPRPYVKRANIDPFEQHYVTPLLRMIDEEEAENAKNKLISDEQKSTLKQLADAAASSEIGRRIVYSAQRTFTQPLESLYDLVTLPADVVHWLDSKTNTGNESGRLLKALQEEEEGIIDPYEIQVLTGDEEEDKEIRQTLDDISTFVRKTGGLPTWGIRKLKMLKKKFFGDDDVDVSSDLQAWNEEEEKEEKKNHAARQLQGLLTSKYQQKGYKERMDATKTLQSLLKAQEVQKEQERLQEATNELQTLLRGKKRSLLRGEKRSLPLDDNDGDDDIPPVVKKSRFDISNLDPKQIIRDVRTFFQDNPNPIRIPEEMHAKLEMYLKNRKRNPNLPSIVYRDSEEATKDGYYQYNPTSRKLIVFPGILDSDWFAPNEGYRWV